MHTLESKKRVKTSLSTPKPRSTLNIIILNFVLYINTNQILISLLQALQLIFILKGTLGIPKGI